MIISYNWKLMGGIMHHRHRAMIVYSWRPASTTLWKKSYHGLMLLGAGFWGSVCRISKAVSAILMGRWFRFVGHRVSWTRVITENGTMVGKRCMLSTIPSLLTIMAFYFCWPGLSWIISWRQHSAFFWISHQLERAFRTRWWLLWICFRRSRSYRRRDVHYEKNR